MKGKKLVAYLSCPVCKSTKPLVRIGATIGGAQLRCCPDCGAVFAELKKIKESK